MDSAVMDPPEVADADVPVVEQEPAEQTTRPNSPPPPTADEIAEAKRIHYEAIREKEVEVRILEGNHASLAEEAKDAKKEFEAADKALRFLISRGYEIPKKYPTRVRAIATLIAPKIEFGQEFDVVEIDEYKGLVRVLVDDETPGGDWLPIGKEVEVVVWGERPMPPAEPVEPEPDESWKLDPISELGLSDKLNEKLAIAGIETMGQLEAHRAAVAENRAQWPKGIGPEKVSQITEAFLDWFNSLEEADSE